MIFLFNSPVNFCFEISMSSIIKWFFSQFSFCDENQDRKKKNEEKENSLILTSSMFLKSTQQNQIKHRLKDISGYF